MCMAKHLTRVFSVPHANFLVYAELSGSARRVKGALSHFDRQFPISYSYFYSTITRKTNGQKLTR